MLLLVILFATLTDEKMPDNKCLMKNKSVCFDGESVVLPLQGDQRDLLTVADFLGL